MSPLGKNRPGLPERRIALIAGLLVVVVMPSVRVCGQNALFGDTSGSNSGVFLPSDRLDTRGIQRAQELISGGEYSQAIRFLDDVLARDEDSFFASSNEQYSGLKETARQMLRDLPPDGRTVYETTFGPVAQRLLQQSVENGDLLLLRQIARRYFYTPAGHEAALLFAQNEADKGRHLTAALTYQQLLESADAADRFQPQLSVLAAMSWLAADQPATAADVLRQLSEQGYRDIQISEQDYPLRASNEDLAAWLLQIAGTPASKSRRTEDQWLTLRGNPSRNGHTDGGLPHLRVRWQVRLLEHRNLESVHEEMSAMLAQQNTSQLPAATPLAVGDYVITRSAHGLLAIDFKSGKRIWQAEPQREQLLKKLMDSTQQQSRGDNKLEPAQSFARMVWEDYLYNTTSSDGQRVYVIRDLTLPNLDQNHAMILMPPRARRGDNSGEKTNRLCAYDLPTQGKLIWEVDGAARQDDLQGAFFLGAPVAVGQSLYCLAEIKSETAIYLIALDRQTGKLQWRQQLADLENGILSDTRRRLQASSPSYESGMLVCPTGAGVVVGVDLAKQALAWAYSYETVPKFSFRRSNRNLRMGIVATPANRVWVQSAPVISDGRVLLTPPESNMLHCVDLRTGKLLWKHERGDSLFLAGVEAGRVVLVGNRGMTALQLADGQPAWPDEQLDLPPDGVPTGSGFFSKGQYFLPLSNAEVIAVDVSRGKIAAKSSSRDGQRLGNMICYRGAVISQTGQFLDCFDQVDVLRAKSQRRRAADATDYEALRTLGEIAYNEGQLTQAIELLGEAYQSEPGDLRTREVLSEALVAALDENFAEHHRWLSLLQQIEQDSAESQLTLLRLQAKGLLEIGRAVEAFDVCLQAYENPALSETELTIGRDHQVLAPRWLAAQSAAVWAAASLEERDLITDRLSPLVESTLQSDDAAQWQLFHECFQHLELVEPVGLTLAADYAARGNLLTAQQLFLKLAASENPQVSNAAVANCSRLLHQADMAHLAVEYDARLRGELADQLCLDGMSGLECLAQWAVAADGSLRQSGRDWPYGQVEWSLEGVKDATRARSSRNPQTGIRIERSDEVLATCQVALLGVVSGRNREITIQDSLGRNFFRAKLDQGAQTRVTTQGGVYGVSRGNLLILSLGRQIVAFDTLSSSGQPLWRKDTTSNLQYANQANAALRNLQAWRRSSISRSKFNWVGIIGPVTHDSCVFQFDQRLICVDPRSGETKWKRNGLPLGADLFGDEQFTFLVPKNSDQAMIFSTADGRFLGETTHAIPASPERLTSDGRNLIRWRKRDDRRWVLSAFDALEGEELWNYDFELVAKIDVAQNRFAAVADSAGRCVVVDLRNGQLTVDHQTEANVSLEEVHLLAGTNDFVVSVQQAPDLATKRKFTGFNQTDYSLAFVGQLYAFDRKTGQANWQIPAEVQGLPLMLSQPVDLPVIAFAGTIRNGGANRSKQIMGLSLLEKSSGRLLYHNDMLPSSPHHCWPKASEVDPNEVVVEMNTANVRLKFTDQPRAPEPPANQEVQRKADAGSKGLQKIGEKLLGTGR